MDDKILSITILGGIIMASLIDYEERECDFCGHIGLLPNGDFDVECPACGAEYSLIDEPEEKEEEEDDDEDE